MANILDRLDKIRSRRNYYHDYSKLHKKGGKIIIKKKQNETNHSNIKTGRIRARTQR